MGSMSNNRTYRKPYDVVFSAALNAAKICNLTINSKGSKSGIIRASAGASILSWGEDINIVVSRNGKNTQVFVSSGAKAQLIDWGKSKKNIDDFFSALEDCL